MGVEDVTNLIREAERRLGYTGVESRISWMGEVTMGAVYSG